MMFIKPVCVGLLAMGWLAISPTAWADQHKVDSSKKSDNLAAQPLVAPVIAEQLNEIEANLYKQPPSTTVKDWMAQIEASQLQITGVRLEETETGLQVILESANGTLAIPTPTITGNVLRADIPNVVLALPDGEAFQQINPATGIDRVSVVGLPGNQVQVEIVGTEAPPTAEVTASASDLTFAITPGTTDTVQEDAEIEITVTAEQTGSEYFVPNASSTLRTDTPLRDTPASVQVIPQRVIEDQGATNAREIVRNAAGVNFSESAGNRDERFILRGFEAGQFRNGFRDDFNSSATQTELANVDRIEVLKGPASILFGRAEPAGIINFVTKKPLREPFYKIDFTAGSFDFYRPTLDFSGPLTTDGNLAYRLNAAYENAGSFRDGVETERFFVAPTLSWKISPNTELGLEFTYLHDTRPIDRGLVVLSNNEVADIPFDTFLGDPNARLDFDETRTELYLDHRFNSNLSLRSLIRYTTSDVNGLRIEIDGDSEDDRIFPIADNGADQSFKTFTIQNDFVAKFNTGAIKHTLLFGFEYANIFFGSNPTIRSGATIDIFNPSRQFAFDESVPLDFEQRTDSFGIYLQDQIALLDNLQLVIGGRFDTFNREEELLFGDFFESTETKANAFSPRVGIVYRPIEPVSLYTSYTRSFNPVSGVNINNEPFDPERGTGFEIGVKTEIIKDRLFSTLAFYDTTLTNVTTEAPNNPNFSVQTGKQNSRGIELDIQGEILPGWSIFAGYAYTDANVTEDNEIPEGNRLVNVPKHNFNLWTTYTLQQGSLAGLGFGAGIFYVGERAGDLENSFFLDDYVRIDAAIYYEREKYRFALNLKNLFDAEFIEGAGGRQEVIPGAPFTILGTVSVKF